MKTGHNHSFDNIGTISRKRLGALLSCVFLLCFLLVAPSARAIDALLKMPHLRRLSLEGSRITFQGVSRLRSSARDLTVDLVVPFAWGQPWSYYDAPAQWNAAGSVRFPHPFYQTTSARPATEGAIR